MVAIRWDLTTKQPDVELVAWGGGKLSPLLLVGREPESICLPLLKIRVPFRIGGTLKVLDFEKNR